MIAITFLAVALMVVRAHPLKLLVVYISLRLTTSLSVIEIIRHSPVSIVEGSYCLFCVFHRLPD